MDAIWERELWDEGVNHISEGQVLASDGKPLSLRVMIQRRWGWPRSAADMASRHLKRQSSNGTVKLYVSREMREQQQTRLFQEVPDLLSMLCTGLAMGASREVADASRTITEIVVGFQGQAIMDDGIGTAVLKAVANRLGCSLEDLRKVTIVRHEDDGTLWFSINAIGFNP